MKFAIRNAQLSASSLSRWLNPKPSPHRLLFSISPPIFPCIRFDSFASRLPSILSCSFVSTSMTNGGGHGEGEISWPTSPTSEKLEKQFDDFRKQLDVSGNVRERIRSVASEIESVTRLMHSSLLLVHQSRPVSEVLEKTKAHIVVLRELFGRLAEILRECPDQYYRYHGDWRSETQSVVSLLGFMHWLETGTLLLHSEAENKLGLNPSEFGLDVEDYLTGICFMSNEMPRYVVNQVTAGDYECPQKVLRFLTDLHTAFRMLNLRNDFLRKKFDSMKYDLRKVEEVHYDVKIRGLATAGGDKVTNGES